MFQENRIHFLSLSFAAGGDTCARSGTFFGLVGRTRIVPADKPAGGGVSTGAGVFVFFVFRGPLLACITRNGECGGGSTPGGYILE